MVKRSPNQRKLGEIHCVTIFCVEEGLTDDTIKGHGVGFKIVVDISTWVNCQLVEEADVVKHIHVTLESSSAMKTDSQIVRLKKVVQRWRCRIPSVGSLAVYVDVERRRFLIPTRYLNLPVFVSLLNIAKEEFGFQTDGGLVLPCNVVFFNKLLNLLERDEPEFDALDLDDFSEMFSDWVMNLHGLVKALPFLISIASLRCCRKLKFEFETLCSRFDFHAFLLTLEHK
ncbi:hypothetical protein L6452_43443 [Arctium lappa]|uniref:Uncharacterized protein n=1 Tax=Arctium lappa TaxID=4217 RepID=A0ACB8XD96_ARCLA|nr:hypothetical protein L6452_43443 [Arctium lappa]